MFKSVVRRNIFANFIGKAWSGLIQLVFVPIYIRLLGMEAFGLIGFFVVLQGLLNVLDLGLSTTLNRELARYSTNDNAQDMINLVYTMELVYWVIAALITIGIIILSPWIARFWINSEGLSIVKVQHSVILIAVLIGAQWSYSLYSGGLMGLQKQVLLNSVRIVLSTIQAVGVIFVLLFISRTIEAYFLWQIIIIGSQTVIVGCFLHSILPKTDRHAVFDWYSLYKCWKFAIGMTGISLVVIILTQADKVILSKLLNLEQFGYYMLAFTIGGILIFLVAPVSTALFPKLSELIVRKQVCELSRLYHKGCQLISLFILPVGITVVFFSKEILMLWTRNPKVVENVYILLRLIIIGGVCNSAVSLPYMLQLAYGWTSLSFYKNIIALVILIPLLFFLISHFGAIGGAFTWIILNVGYILFEIPIMHKRILKNEMKIWYIFDFGLPLLCCVAIGTILKNIFFYNTNTILSATQAIIVSLGGMFLVSVLVIPSSREYLKKVIQC